MKDKTSHYDWKNLEIYTEKKFSGKTGSDIEFKINGDTLDIIRFKWEIDHNGGIITLRRKGIIEPVVIKSSIKRMEVYLKRIRICGNNTTNDLKIVFENGYELDNLSYAKCDFKTKNQFLNYNLVGY